MKRMLIVTTVSLLSLSLGAAEKPPAKTAAPAKAQQAAKQPADSPLAAGAKRARRGAGKSVVITDDTVKNSTGRVTSTTIVYAPPDAPKDAPASAEVLHIQQRAKAKTDEEKKTAAAVDAKKKKDAATARLARMAEDAEQGEDGYNDDVDPAQLERDLAAHAAAEAKKP